MVKKLQKTSATKKPATPLAGSVKESAQQIWQAGLGALSKAQAEGSRVIETILKEGVSMQRKTQSAAEEKISEASSKMSSMANDIASKATGQWDKLESIFEDRVAKALNKLGVPSAKDINALIVRIDELNKNVQKLSGKTPAPPAAKKVVKAAPNPAVKTSAVRKPASRKTARAARSAS